MSISPSDYEKLGQFYLGRGYDPEAKKVEDDLILYDSKDLVTHGVVLGMTGSGKTGLCLALLEEAAMDNIPAIIIDPKGDISNLLLMFPDLDAKSFRPWVNEDDAAKKGISPDEHAAKTAELWKTGLADWGQNPERIATLRDKVDINIFTPGSKAGIPVSILSSLEVPPFEIMDDAELLGERVESTVASLLSLVGVDGDAIQSPEAVLVSAIFQHAWAAEQNVTLETLIRHIQKPAFDKVGVIDLESFMPEKSRQSLALKFNNLLASPGFATWLDGPPLDIAKMLHTPAGKPRISIFSIAHLGDTERMFFVSLLLNQMLGWMRAQNGTTSLRALLYMDEIFGYLPPSANPPSKRPMMTILKQGRAFGLGCLLATQNPVDLDYKALSNIGTWFLGRLQTERDKLRVLDGLEGAAGSQNAKFDRASMERLISGLGNRVFLMNNVHEDAPVIFHVRWVMSYLTGPLTRSQIKLLMDPKRGDFMKISAPSEVAEANPMAMPGMSAKPAAAPASRPNVGAGIKERFMEFGGNPTEVVYRPYLLRVGSVHFSHAKSHGEITRTVRILNPVLEKSIGWDKEIPLPSGLDDAREDPVDDLGFTDLPGFAMNAANYKQVEKDFSEALYDKQRAEILFSPDVNAWSKIDETEQDFRKRISHSAREARDRAMEGLREKAQSLIQKLETQKATAADVIAKEKVESTGAAVKVGMRIVGSGALNWLKGKFPALEAVLGRKSTSRGSSTTTINEASQAYKQYGDVKTAKNKLAAIEQELAKKNAEMNEAIAALQSSYEPDALKIERQPIKPSKTDVKVIEVGLLWIPENN